MRQLLTITFMLLMGFVSAQKIPTIQKTKFTKEVLSQTLENTSGKNVTVKDILSKHKGEVIVIDFWASWCRDCILALPKAEELEKNNPNITFLYFNLERSKEAFGKAISRFNMEDKNNYWFSTGWKNKFNDYIDLNWIPRYMVIDQKGDIAKYYAISPEDPDIQSTINKLTTTQE